MVAVATIAVAVKQVADRYATYPIAARDVIVGGASFNRSATIDCYAGGRKGTSMATDVWQLQGDEPADHRRADRHAIAVRRASVRGMGEQPADAELLDLSIYGCRIAVATEHDTGDRL